MSTVAGVTPSSNEAAPQNMGPVSLTAGMPTPDAILRQKEAYKKILEDQLKQGVLALDTQTQYQRDLVNAQADTQKKQFIMQLDNETKQQEMMLLQHHAAQSIKLQRDAAQAKAVLEQQATQLLLEFQQKKAEEEMQNRQYEMERQQNKVQVEMDTELNKLGVSTPSLLPCPAGNMQLAQSTKQLGRSFHFTPMSMNTSQSFAFVKQPSLSVSTTFLGSPKKNTTQSPTNGP